MPLYKRDDTAWVEDFFALLEDLFAHVDDFVGDIRLRAEVDGMDEETLRQRGQRAYDRLLVLSLALASEGNDA
jgi:hypothetical protein